MRLCSFLFACCVLSFVLIPDRSHAQDVEPRCLTFPAHIVIRGGYDTVACELSTRSSTLAQQLRTLAASPHVYVVIRQPLGALYGCRARARIRRSETGVHALIEIPFTSDFAELLSHELEHVLEQLEGLDLARMASDGGTSVYRTASGAYETERARLAGRAARREVLSR